MNERFKKIRTWAARSLTALLAVQTLAFQPVPVDAAAATPAECLTINGTGKVPVKQVDIDQEFAIEYTLTPDGKYTSVEQRDPVDISLVLDVSGSMLYGLDGDTKAKAPNRRVDALKTATNTLIAKFKEINLDSVGLVQFSTKASKVSLAGANSSGLTTNYGDLQSKINGLSYTGSTNIDDALRKANDMLEKSTRKKFVILLTDGAANRYGINGTSAPNSSLDPTSKGRSEALKRADELKQKNITVYPIGLMTPQDAANIYDPKVANKGEMDVYLMSEIAKRTGGTFYAASSAASLGEVFNSIVNVITNTTLKNITLSQPLPAGFDLADSELTNPLVRKEGNNLIVSFEDIPYPFTNSSYTKTVKLKATPQVVGEEHPLTDPTVTYTNACENKQSFNIHLDSTIVILGITETDMYGNVYYGNYAGKLTRKRADNNQLQWTYTDPSGRRIKAIEFVKPDGTPDNGTDKTHTLVKLTFESGEPTTLDLRPSTPVVQMVDSNGNTLSSTTWATGDIRLKVDTASISGLNAVNTQIEYTDAGKSDFGTGFIKGYEYTLDDGKTWQPLTYSGGEYGVTLSTEGTYSAKVRAVNETISLNASQPVYSNEALASAKMDNTPPAGDGKVTIIIDEKTKVQNDAKIVINGSDSLSGVKEIEVWLDDQSNGRIFESATASFKLSEIAGYGDENARFGWHQIKVRITNEAGLSKTYDFGELIADFKINPGAKAAISLKDHAGGDYSSSNWADKPVKVLITVDHPVKARYGNPEVEIDKSEYAIVSEDGIKNWRPLSSNSFYVTPSGDKGTFIVHFQFTDKDGVVKEFQSSEVNIDFNQNRY